MNDNRQVQSAGNLLPRISRRDSLKWFGLVLATNALAPYPSSARAAPPGSHAGHWPALDLPPVRADGYGQDPDLVGLTSGPWPRTLTPVELATVSTLAGIIVPREGEVPSAAELHAEDVVDEWVSAPYADQQRDREPVVALLHWLDDESEQRFGKPFADIDPAQRLAIIDDIAWWDTAEQYQRAAHAFDRLRSIVVAAFFCTPQGSADLGYLGGVAIAGDYPGPTKEAAEHLRQVLASLELEEYTE